jgi:hypothetical protein
MITELNITAFLLHIQEHLQFKSHVGEYGFPQSVLENAKEPELCPPKSLQIHY